MLSMIFCCICITIPYAFKKIDIINYRKSLNYISIKIKKKNNRSYIQRTLNERVRFQS